MPSDHYVACSLTTIYHKTCAEMTMKICCNFVQIFVVNEFANSIFTIIIEMQAANTISSQVHNGHGIFFRILLNLNR